MKIPKTIRIGGHPYKIKTAKTLENEDGTSLWGKHDSVNGIITIRAGHPSPTAEVDTLLHEILHAIFNGFEYQEGDKEERIVACVAHGLTELFASNPKLLDYLKEALKR